MSDIQNNGLQYFIIIAEQKKKNQTGVLHKNTSLGWDLNILYGIGRE